MQTIKTVPSIWYYMCIIFQCPHSVDGNPLADQYASKPIENDKPTPIIVHLIPGKVLQERWALDDGARGARGL